MSTVASAGRGESNLPGREGTVSGLRWGVVRARTTCTSCGHPLPLTCIAEVATCAHCSAELAPTDRWAELIEMLDDVAAHSGPFEGTLGRSSRALTYHIDRATPSCVGCGAAFPVDWLTGESRDFTCASCGRPAHTEPAPPWLRHAVSTARQVVTFAPASAPGSSSVHLKAGASRLVALSCPRCGGGLEISERSPRLFGCRYCGADVYAPDASWHRLHPVRTVQPIYVGFEGPSLRQQRDARALEELERQDAERREKSQGAKRARDEQVQSAKAMAWVATGLHVTVLAGIAWFLYAGSFEGVASEIYDRFLRIVMGRIPLPQDIRTVLYAVVALFAASLIACAFVSRPLRMSARQTRGWAFMQTWLFVLLIFFVPIVGSLVSAFQAVFLGLVGRTYGYTVSSGDERSSSKVDVPSVRFLHGEGRPAAFLLSALAVGVPLAVSALFDLGTITAAP